MLITSAIANTTAAIGIDDNRRLNPTILTIDLATLTKKCGVNFSFIL